MMDMYEDVEAMLESSCMDEYLSRLGLLRKPIQRDGSCLFRAVADQILLCEQQHGEVRQACIDYLRENRPRFEAFIEGSFDEYMLRLHNPKEWAGEIEIAALSEIYAHDFIIFTEVDQLPRNITQNSYKKQILLCFSTNSHYDIIYPKSFIRNTNFCKSLLYELLHERVFAMSSGEPVKFLPAHKDTCIVDKQEETRPRCDAAGSSVSSLDMIGHCTGSMPDEKPAAEEDEIDRREMRILPGDKCQVIHEDSKLYHAHIQEISADNLTATVFVEEIASRICVPCTSLRPLPRQSQDTGLQRRPQRKKKEMPLVVPFGRGSILPPRLWQARPGRRPHTRKPDGEQQGEDDDERKFIEDSVALIEIQERDTNAFPALPNRQDKTTGPKLFWSDMCHDTEDNSQDSQGESASQLSVTPPTSPALSAARGFRQRPTPCLSNPTPASSSPVLPSSMLTSAQPSTGPLFPCFPAMPPSGKHPINNRCSFPAVTLTKSEVPGPDTQENLDPGNQTESDRQTYVRDLPSQVTDATSQVDLPSQVTDAPSDMDLPSQAIDAPSNEGPTNSNTLSNSPAGVRILASADFVKDKDTVVVNEEPKQTEASCSVKQADKQLTDVPNEVQNDNDEPTPRKQAKDTSQLTNGTANCPLVNTTSSLLNDKGRGNMDIPNVSQQPDSIENHVNTLMIQQPVGQPTYVTTPLIQQPASQPTQVTTPMIQQPAQVTTPMIQQLTSQASQQASPVIQQTTQVAATLIQQANGTVSPVIQAQLPHQFAPVTSYVTSHVAPTVPALSTSYAPIIAPQSGSLTNESTTIQHTTSPSPGHSQQPSQCAATPVTMPMLQSPMVHSLPYQPPILHPTGPPNGHLPVPPAYRMPFTVPSYPWLAAMSPHLSNFAGPVNFNAMPSADPSGADLPHSDVNTLRFFFNLGHEYYRASMMHMSAPFPMHPPMPVVPPRPEPSQSGMAHSLQSNMGLASHSVNHTQSSEPNFIHSSNSSQSESSQSRQASQNEKKPEGVVVYVENDAESSGDEDKADNHNTSYEDYCVPGHADSGCVSDVSSNGAEPCVLAREDTEHRPDVADHHSDSSSQHSGTSLGLSPEFINFCRTFCSPAPQNQVRSRRSPPGSTKLLKPLKDIPPRFQKMLSQNAVGKEEKFEGAPLVRQVAMISRKSSSKSSSVSSSTSDENSYVFNPNAQAFTPSSGSYECSMNYSPATYSSSDPAVVPTADDYPPPYNYIMNGTCYYPAPVVAPPPPPSTGIYSCYCSHQPASYPSPSAAPSTMVYTPQQHAVQYSQYHAPATQYTYST